jgi:hypothetical protein
MLKSVSHTIVLLGALGLGSTQIAVGQTPEQRQGDRQLLLFYKNMADATVAEFRRQIEPLLPASQRQIEEAVAYKVTTSLSATAFASREGGERRIVVNGGWLLTLDQVTMAGIANYWGAKECSHRFLFALFDGIRANSNPARSGPLLRGGDLFEFAGRQGALCPNVLFDRFQQDAEAERIRQVTTGASMFFLLAHELGHQVYNHELGDGPEEDRLAQSRKNETQADVFALQMMARKEFEPALAFPAFLMLVGLNGYSAEEEQRSTHPSGLKRIQPLLDSLRTLADRDPDFKGYLERSERATGWQQLLRQMNSAIEEGLRNK